MESDAPERKLCSDASLKQSKAVHDIPHIADRLKRIRTALAYTQKEIAESIGSKQRSWQDYETDKARPGSMVIAGLVNLGFNANWILTGTGPMRLDELVDPGTVAGGRLYARIPLFDEGSEDLSVVTEDTADYLPRSLSIASLSLSSKWLESIEVEPGDLIGFIMSDDTMQPTIPRNALVYADGYQETVNTPGLWAFQIDDKTTAARLHPEPNGQILITYDNQIYRDRTLPAASIMILGKVVWYGGSVA